MKNIKKAFKQSIEKLEKGVDGVYYVSYDAHSDKTLTQGILKKSVTIEPTFGLVYYNDSTLDKQFYHHYGTLLPSTDDSQFGLIIDSSKFQKINIFFQNLSSGLKLFLSSDDESLNLDVFIAYNEFLSSSTLIIGFKTQTNNDMTFKIIKSFTQENTNYIRFCIENILPEINKTLFVEALLQSDSQLKQNSEDKF